MPRPPAVSTAPDSSRVVVDADVCARAGSIIERHYSVGQLPRLQEAGVQDRSRIDMRLQFSLFDGRPAIDGRFHGLMNVNCQRCMQPVAVPVDENFQVIVVAQESADEPGGYEPVVAEAARFDLRWLAEEQALLAMPLVPQHAEGECDEAVAQPLREQDASPGSQQPFQNLRDLLEK